MLNSLWSRKPPENRTKLAREAPLKMGSRIRWGRVAVAAILSEVLVVAVVIVTTSAYRFLIAPGRTVADYAAFGELAAYYVAPAAAGLGTFFGALWVGRKLTAGFLANGTLVGGVVAQRMSSRWTAPLSTLGEAG
jgi:Mn2+/Fe2+ NRAMP family transporter